MVFSFGRGRIGKEFRLAQNKCPARLTKTLCAHTSILSDDRLEGRGHWRQGRRNRGAVCAEQFER